LVRDRDVERRCGYQMLANCTASIGNVHDWVLRTR
jgi:hypothetical protein